MSLSIFLVSGSIPQLKSHKQIQSTDYFKNRMLTYRVKYSENKERNVGKHCYIPLTKVISFITSSSRK